MECMPQKASKAIVSHIYKLIRADKFSRLIALIYDRILEDSQKPFLNKAQTEVVLSLLCLPSKHIPNIVSYVDLCVLLKNAYDEKFGSAPNNSDEIISTSENSSDEEANLEELEVLSTLNTLRDKTHTQCTDVFVLIRQENLIRTVLRQARRLRRMKGNLHEMEQKVDYFVANYLAEKYSVCQTNEYLECDSGCHTERSSSPNNSLPKLKKTDDTDRMNSSKSLQTMNGLKGSGINLQLGTLKLLSEFGKSLSDANISISKPSTSAVDPESNCSMSSIKQISTAEAPKGTIMPATESGLSKVMNASIARPSTVRVKLLSSNSASKVTDKSDEESLLMSMQPAEAGNEILPKSRKKLTKLQLKTDLGFHIDDDQIPCKKIELKKYVEFDTSSLWNKK